jgi:hypothetical protein
MTILRTILPLAFLALLAAGCYAEAGAPAGGCGGGRWVEGHYGPRHVWHARHWGCPGDPVDVE